MKKVLLNIISKIISSHNKEGNDFSCTLEIEYPSYNVKQFFEDVGGIYFTKDYNSTNIEATGNVAMLYILKEYLEGNPKLIEIVDHLISIFDHKLLLSCISKQYYFCEYDVSITRISKLDLIVYKILKLNILYGLENSEKIIGYGSYTHVGYGDEIDEPINNYRSYIFESLHIEILNSHLSQKELLPYNNFLLKYKSFFITNMPNNKNLIRYINEIPGGVKITIWNGVIRFNGIEVIKLKNKQKQILNLINNTSKDNDGISESNLMNQVNIKTKNALQQNIKMIRSKIKKADLDCYIQIGYSRSTKNYIIKYTI